MTLTQEQLDALLRWVGLTRSHEIDCDQCLALIAEFAETVLANKSIPEGLEAVEQHLALCGECREEYEALQRALGSLDD